MTEEGENKRDEPIVMHPIIGTVNQPAIFPSLADCTIGVVIIPSTARRERNT